MSNETKLNGPPMTTELTKAAQQALEALESASNGLTWYQQEHPEDDSLADEEMHEALNQAMRDLRTALTQRPAAPTLKGFTPPTAEGLDEMLAISGDFDASAGAPCSRPPGCNGSNCLGCGERPAAQTEREVDTGPRVLREVFALCEDTIDKMAGENTEFSRGRAFEAKGISRAIGTWFQDEYCGRSYMGEPSLPAPQQATPEPVPAEQAKWCEYVAGMVDCWINSHWPNYNHMDEDRRVKAIAGIIERRLWALQKQAAATPEPVGESAGRIELDCRQWLEDQRIDGGPHGFEAVGVEALSRMWRAARASNQTELVGEVSAESILNQWMAECGVYMVEKMGHQWASQTKQADLLYLVEKAITCTRPAPGVPKGFARVPVEPTAEMMEAMPSLPAIGAPGDMELKAKGWSLKAIQNRHRWLAALAAAQAKGGAA